MKDTKNIEADRDNWRKQALSEDAALGVLREQNGALRLAVAINNQFISDMMMCVDDPGLVLAMREMIAMNKEFMR